MNKSVVLRLCHRPGRDQRISSHVALVARAFGADGIIFADYQAKKVKASLEKVNEEWGGSFFVKGGESWRREVDDWRSKGGKVVHLTMYGLPVDEEISEIRKCDDVLVVIGAGKVPGELYNLADFNVAIGNQPHSEVSALALFLDRLYKGVELKKEFSDAKKRIVPSDSGKKVENLKERE